MKKLHSPPPPLAEIKPGQSIELLKALHILTVDGKMNQDSRRKLKQVYHLIQFIEPLIRHAAQTRGEVNLVDHGAGKSYLGFILYDLVMKTLNVPHHTFGIEARSELVKKARVLAETLSFSRMSFLDIAAAQAADAAVLDRPIDIVTALHACDTATDDAIAFALNKKARSVVLVPCCQAALAAHWRTEKKSKSASTVAELWAHPIRAREFGAHLTNVLRSLQLEAHGYRVTVTELVGWEHSLKNELILAEFKNLPRAPARARLEATLDTFGLGAMREQYLGI
jgi:hypothetical protein